MTENDAHHVQRRHVASRTGPRIHSSSIVQKLVSTLHDTLVLHTHPLTPSFFLAVLHSPSLPVPLRPDLSTSSSPSRLAARHLLRPTFHPHSLLRCGGLWLLNMSRSVSLDTLPVALWGICGTNTTSSGTANLGEGQVGSQPGRAV